MAELNNLSSNEAYLEGRLLGLNQLISLLRDAYEVDDAGSSRAIVRSIVEHISSEMDVIIDELKEIHGSGHPALKQAEKKQVVMAKEVKKASASGAGDEKVSESLKKNVDTADDLMKSLMELREKGVTASE